MKPTMSIYIKYITAPFRNITQNDLSHKSSSFYSSGSYSQINGLLYNSSHSTVSLPYTKSFISCKWVFRIKENSNVFFTMFKARLKAKDQKYGLNFQETFSHAVKPIRTILTTALSQSRKVYQLDVNNTF